MMASAARLLEVSDDIKFSRGQLNLLVVDMEEAVHEHQKEQVDEEEDDAEDVVGGSQGTVEVLGISRTVCHFFISDTQNIVHNVVNILHNKKGEAYYLKILRDILVQEIC